MQQAADVHRGSSVMTLMSLERKDSSPALGERKTLRAADRCSRCLADTCNWKSDRRCAEGTPVDGGEVLQIADLVWAKGF